METQLQDVKVAVVGGGNMGKAIIHRLLHSGIFFKEQIKVSARTQKTLNLIQQNFNLEVTNDNRSCIQGRDIIILTVKPQDFYTVAFELKGYITEHQTLLSVIPGVFINLISKAMEVNKVVRVMPTISAAHGTSVSVWTCNPYLNENDKSVIKRILQLLGVELFVEDENLVDYSATICGCGVGYFLYFLDLLITNGMKLGFSESEATYLAKGAIEGTVSLIRHGKHSMKTMLQEVATSGGLTEAAIKVFDERQLPDLIRIAIDSAVTKASKFATDMEQNLRSST